MIACFQLAPWATTLERLAEPVLREQPLVLTLARGVYGTCEVAERAGVQVGMAEASAVGLCPEAQYRPARPTLYRHLAEEWAALLGTFSDKLEVRAAPQALHSFVELPPLREDEALEMTREMGRALSAHLRLSPSAGLANGKFPAQVAASASRPLHARVMHTTTAAGLLAVRPIETLPCPPEMARRLHLLGIHTVGQFAALPAGAVFQQWGKTGRHLHQLAQGRDRRPLEVYVTRPAEEVAHVAEEPIETWQPLNELLSVLVGQLAWQLRRRRMQARRATLQLTLADGTTRTRERRQAEPAGSEAALEALFLPLLRQTWFHCGVAGLTLRADDLVPLETGTRQLTLFAEGPAQARQFEALLPYLRRRYGTNRFLAVTLDEGARLPEKQVRLTPRRG